MRRAAYVLFLLALMQEGKNSSNLLYAYLYIESLLFIYLILQMPHIENEFNVLEIVTSILMMLVLYSMFGFLTTSVLDSNTQWKLGYGSCTLILLIVVLNTAILVYGIVLNIKLKLKKSRITKAYEEEKRKRKVRE